jgi:hypothetical protein
MTLKVDHERMAIELKQWLRSQNRYRTIRELEAPTGIPYSSLKDYFAGDAAPRGERLQRLAALTRVPALLATDAKARPSASERGECTAEESARRVSMTLRRLMDELDFFKRGTPEDRSTLKRMVPARDVGYATTLLKAMYDEDQFQAWVYFSEYKPEGR